MLEIKRILIPVLLAGGGTVALLSKGACQQSTPPPEKNVHEPQNFSSETFVPQRLEITPPLSDRPIKEFVPTNLSSNQIRNGLSLMLSAQPDPTAIGCFLNELLKGHIPAEGGAKLVGGGRLVKADDYQFLLEAFRFKDEKFDQLNLTLATTTPDSRASTLPLNEERLFVTARHDVNGNFLDASIEYYGLGDEKNLSNLRDGDLYPWGARIQIAKNAEGKCEVHYIPLAVKVSINADTGTVKLIEQHSNKEYSVLGESSAIQEFQAFIQTANNGGGILPKSPVKRPLKYDTSSVVKTGTYWENN
jgi:hypothetical protein